MTRSLLEAILIDGLDDWIDAGGYELLRSEIASAEVADACTLTIRFSRDVVLEVRGEQPETAVSIGTSTCETIIALPGGEGLARSRPTRSCDSSRPGAGGRGGNSPTEHSNPKDGQDPHFRPTDGRGQKKVGGGHPTDPRRFGSRGGTGK